MFDSNRRKYPRANYPCQLTMWLADGTDETILANTSNVGAGGICVHLNQSIEIGARVEVLLQFNKPTTPFKCKGVVVRSRRENERFFNIGIQFEPLTEVKFAFIESKVAELIELEEKGNI